MGLSGKPALAKLWLIYTFSNWGRSPLMNEKFPLKSFPSFLNSKILRLLVFVLASTFFSSCEENPLGREPGNHLQVQKTELASNVSLVYRRHDYMNYWIDKDGDCRNLRHEMLERQSLEEVKFKTTKNCSVERGLWVDPYTNKSVKLASDLDVDHVIPLAYAHQSGGSVWSGLEKRQFAMDEDNLLLVDDAENSRKGAKGPSQYLPVKGFHCEYARIWQAVSEKYNLSLLAADRLTLTSVLNRCFM